MNARARRPEEQDENTPPKFQSFDDILVHVGEAGRFQWLLFLTSPLSIFTYTFLYFGQFFLTLIPEEHWCKVPEFENTNLTDWQRIDLSVPSTSYNGDDVNSYVSYSRCKMYITNYTEVLLTGQKPGPDTPIGSCQYGWSFNQTSVPYLSIGAELEWVCDKAYLGTAAQSIFFMGSIVGGLIFGYIADRYGRRPALIACNAVGLLASISTGFCNSFWSFAVARFIVGTSFDNCHNIIFIIVMEYVGPKYRTLMLNTFEDIYFASAMCLLPWIAYWLSNWKLLSVVCALPFFIIFLTSWIVPESARWYIQNDRIDEAVKIIKKLARVNKKNIEKEVYVEFEKSCKKMKDSNNNCTLLDSFKLPRLRCITVILIMNWLLMTFVFDGLIWNMKALHPNIFISFSLSSIAELPPVIVVYILLDKWGRRWMSFLSMLLCGIFAFLTLAMPFGMWATCAAAVARSGISIAVSIAYQQATELLPTVVRAQSVSLIHIIGFIAHMLGPGITYAAKFEPWLPLIILGTLSCASAFLSLTLPETMDQQLPDTLEEGNNFGKKQSFWWIPCIKNIKN